MAEADTATAAAAPAPAPAPTKDAAAAKLSTKSSNPLLLLSYATIAGLWGLSQVVLIPYVVHLLLLVTAILYAACHASLILREEPDPNAEEHKDENGNPIPPPPTEKETLRKEDAYQFPLIGSLSLFSLYLAFKYLDKDLVNLLIGAYFGVVGCFAVAMTISPVLKRVAPPSLNKNIGWTYTLNHGLPEWLAGPSPWDLSLEITGVEIVSLLVSAAICLVYFQKKSWYLNNLLGISFCLQGIERFSLGTYKIGAILLVGLFFYDIFWVFGTEVMVTVAKNLDGPIKILFPRSLVPDAETGKLDLSLLGLGDIVVPGFFLALLLRFDAHKANQPIYVTDYHADFPKPYFHSALIAYVAGLGTTLFVMLKFNAAQPALLYLVPACLGSSLLCAFTRGEMHDLFEYSEEEEEEEEEEKEEAKEGEEKTKEEDKKDQ